MSINELIVKPNLDRLHEAFRRLGNEMNGQQSGEAAEIRDAVAQSIREIESIAFGFGAINEDAADVYRRLKMAYRVAERRYKKVLSNESRFKKTLERRIHVSSVAA